MIGALDTMGIEGGSNPEALAEDISLALVTTAGGLAISLIALPFFIIAIILFFRSSRIQNAPHTQTEQTDDGSPKQPSS